jgi:hypothetical protein
MTRPAAKEVWRPCLRDGGLRLETSIFHVNWDNGSPGLWLANNEQNAALGRAMSNGFELTAQALIGDHAKMALSLAYMDAHFTQTVRSDGLLFVAKGDALPVSPWNVTASLERDFPLRANVTASVRFEDAFRSGLGRTYLDNPGFYDAAGGDRSVNVLNLRIAVDWSSFELAAFLSNALDSHPVLAGRSAAVTNIGAPMVVTLTPRTLSVSGTWRF